MKPERASSWANAAPMPSLEPVIRAQEEELWRNWAREEMGCAR